MIDVRLACGLLATLLMPILLLVATPRAWAHEWYPMECCSGVDCAPVEKVEIIQPAIASMLVPQAQASPLGGMLVTTKRGSVVVPADFPRRESRDHRMHACMRPAAGGAGMRLICVFFPPAM